MYFRQFLVSRIAVFVAANHCKRRAAILKKLSMN